MWLDQHMARSARSPFVVATVNVNGIRAAVRKGMHEWLDERRPDVVTLQEVRAPDALAAELMGPSWHLAHHECSAKGRAGVAIAGREPLGAVETWQDTADYAATGRWIEAEIDAGLDAPVVVVSVYVHTGDAESPERMAEKLAFLDAMTRRMQELRDQGRHVLVTGDLNVAHRPLDLKNWKGNLTSAGFLPEERAYFDRWFDELGWVDVVRRLRGEVAGPYSWWSYRGRAFDTDAGWRIDYQIASPELAERATEAAVDRAPAYDQRWSDHAPVVVAYRR